MFGFNKYHYSFIYNIVCLDPNIDDFYIGSTIHLNTRCKSHMRNSITKTHKIYDCKLYTFIRDSGGYENWEMQVIKQFKCENRKELLKEEQKYIDELKPSLNTTNSYTTKEEEEEKVKERGKKWYQDNKERINEKQKKWHQDNKEKIKEKRKKYCQDNKERIKEKGKKYRENNKEKYKENIECECGSVIRKYEIPTHSRTKKHQAYLNNLSS